MITYLISFILCTGLLLLVYRILLAREHLLRFNRLYLLVSLAFSLVVPLMTINTGWHLKEHRWAAVVQQGVTSEQIDPVEPVPADLQATPTAAMPIDWKVIAIWIYSAITLGLLARFSMNLYSVIYKKRKTHSTENAGVKLFLTDSPLPPHSFFNNIFLNRAEFEAGAISEQVICHEQAHARQLHSLDVVLVELMQALCWFNPFIPLYRRAVQLNHEYLADASVVDRYKDTSGYQYLILSMSGGARQSDVALSSEFNYQTLKKRLIMLTKTTTRSAAVCRQIAVLPVFAIAVLLFTQKIDAQNSSDPTPKTGKALPIRVTGDLNSDTLKPKPYPIPNAALRPKHAASDAPENIMSEYAGILHKYHLSDSSGNISDITPDDRTRMHELFTQMSTKQQDAQWIRFSKTYLPPGILTNNTSLEKWRDAATYGVWIDGKRIKNENLTNYTATDFANVYVSRLTPQAVKNDGFKVQVDLQTKAYRANYIKRELRNGEDRLEHIRLVKFQPSKKQIAYSISTSD